MLAIFLKQYFIKLHPVDQIRNQAAFLRDAGCFLCDISFGVYYLTEAQQLEQFAAVKDFFESLQNLPNLSGEQWAKLLAQVAADATFFGISGKAFKHLKALKIISNIPKQTSNLARNFATRWKNILSEWKKTFGTEFPAATTAEDFKVKVLPKNTNFMGKSSKEIGDKAGKASSRSNQFHNKMRGKPKAPSYKVEKASKSKSLKKTTVIPIIKIRK